MKSNSILLSLWMIKREDGTIKVDLRRTNEEYGSVSLQSTGYSDASLCFEEVSSMIDAVLWSWVVANHGSQTELPIG